MPKILISVTPVMVSNDYGYDDKIGINVNSQPNDKVQAFVDCFKDTALQVKEACFGLPEKFILAQWGAESGWASAEKSYQNQNWGGIKGGSYANCKGKAANGYSIFYGRKTFADAYIRIINNVPNDKNLREYLMGTSQPSVSQCINLMAASGYNADGEQFYKKLLTDCVASLEKRSNLK